MTNKINGIDVSESVLTATNNNIYYSQIAVDELQNNIKRLQEENESLKSLNDFNVQKIEVLQEENEELREEIYATRNNRLKMYESFETKCNKCKQTLQKLLDKIDEVLE